MWFWLTYEIDEEYDGWYVTEGLTFLKIWIVGNGKLAEYNMNLFSCLLRKLAFSVIKIDKESKKVFNCFKIF